MSPANRPIPEIVWLLLLAAWTLFMGLVGRQAFVANFDAVLGMAEAVADSHFDDENAYRQWSLLHGGVYVSVNGQTPPNPYLAHIPERDLVTPSGRKLTLVDANYMNRQVNELARQSAGVKVHITSLEPLRPENAPRDWERQGLEQLRAEVTRKKVLSNTLPGEPGERLLRVVYALRTTAVCHDCHDPATYPVGSLRGGLSIEVPLGPYQLAQSKSLAYILFLCILAWAAGLWLIEMFRRYIETRLKREVQERHAVTVSERRFRTLFEESAHGSAVVDEQSGLILAANRALADLAGRGRADLVATPLTSLFREQIELSSLLEAGSCRQPLHLRSADGSLRDVECQVSCIELEGRPALYCAFYDNTLRNLYLAETIRTSQMASLGELSAGVAHEINNPVGGVINYAQILLNRRQLQADDQESELLKRIIKEGERIASIVRSLLAFSRADGDRVEAVTLRQVVDEALALISGRLHQDGIEATVDIPDDLPAVRGNPQQLEQLVLNLLGNASDSLNSKFAVAARSEKQLRLTARLVEQRLRLEVYDNGSGVSEALREKIFTPFFSTKPAEKGTGLGLSICAEIARRHGGSIELDSRSGDYSRFTLILPPA